MELSDLQEIIDEARKTAQDKIPEYLKGIMPAHEKVIAIGWTQYTPYFNDGDPCTFSIGDPFYVLKGQDLTESMNSYEQECNNASEYVTIDEYDKIRKLTRFLNDNKTVAFSLFTEDGIVSVWKQEDGAVKVTIDEYEHD